MGNKEDENKKGKKILWAIIVIIFIGIIGIVVFAVARQNTFKNEIIPNYNNLQNLKNDIESENNSSCNSNNENSNVFKEYINESPTTIYDAKPIIYLYPTETRELTVKLGYPEKITCSYPKYENEWKVIATPNGTLKDLKTGKNLYSLYWEGAGSAATNMNEGFVVKGEESANFLEEKLAILGLSEREAEEFIIYWLPKLENNKYNYIRFATLDEINKYMPLEISAKPDSLIRILMQFKGLESKIKIKEQKLNTPKREGFVVVEWGGTELN